MDTSPELLLSAAWLTARVILVGTCWLYLVTLGNPRELRAQANIVRYLTAAPPTAVFRWRRPPGGGLGSYEVVVYNAATDEEEVKPALFQPAWWSPTYLLWRKRRPQPRDVMVRTSVHAFLLRLVFYLCFYLGSFCLIGWLAVTESWYWWVAFAVLALHQLAFSRAERYMVWLRMWLFVVIGPGAWLYLQGEGYEAIAVCAVGGLVMIAILGQWYMTTSQQFKSMRDLGMGPFDPSRRRRLR